MKLSLEREPIQRLGLETPSMSEIVNVRRRQERRLERLKARSYQAAAIHRLSRDWPTVTRSQRTEHWRSLRTIRARVRHLAHNNDYYKKFLSTVRNKVAGPTGIMLRHESDIVAAKWKEWTNPENASVNRQTSFTGILRRTQTLLARDGEFCFRHFVADNAFGYAIKFIDVNWLDELYNDVRPNGNRVIMSVEIDANDVPVAYWFTPPGDEYSIPGMHRPERNYRTRIPASEIVHRFLPDDENAGDDTLTRGMPWAHTAMVRLHQLGALEEAALVAARAGASKMGFFIPPAESDLDGDPEEDPENAEKLQIDHFQPGTFWELPPGYTYESHDPAYPNGDLGPLVKEMLRGAASGLDISYNSWANDLEGVNYSSMRSGLLEERDVWISLQQFAIESVCRPVFNQWLKNATLSGALPLRPRDLDKLAPAAWRPRGWKWVDPLKDVQASEKEIHLGLNTITDILEEQGRDVREVFATRAKEIKLAKELGIPLGTPADFKPVNLDETEPEPPPAKKK